MKDYFKYKFGYVNIDNDNLYFTSSGNWSETINMKEKGVQKQKRIKKTATNIFFSLAVIILAMLNLKVFYAGKISLFLLILLLLFPIGLYYAYKYLSPELGSQFKLPLAKINDIEIKDNNIHLTFLGAGNNKETYLVEGASEKGVKIFEEIKNNIHQQQ